MEKEKKSKHFIQKPVYPGGPKALTEFIYQNLRYPAQALEARIEGMVVVDYDIDETGKVVDTRILKSVGHGCDEEAARVVRMLKFDIGRNRGVHVLFHQKARIQFKLPPPVVAPPPVQQWSYTVTFTPSEPQPEENTEQKQVFTYTISL